MSRNLGRTNCYYCNGTVTKVESNRHFTEQDAKDFFSDYRNMVVANAECTNCKATYLAWVKYIPGVQDGQDEYYNNNEPFFRDLSFRHSFNDEPHYLDLPLYDVYSSELDALIAKVKNKESGASEVLFDLILQNNLQEMIINTWIDNYQSWLREEIDYDDNKISNHINYTKLRKTFGKGMMNIKVTRPVCKECAKRLQPRINKCINLQCKMFYKDLKDKLDEELEEELESKKLEY